MAVPAPEPDAAPLSVVQEAIWYTSRLHPRRLTYNETIPIRKRGPLDAEVLREALRELIRRHESLRTHLRVVGGKPVQVVGEVPEFDLPVIDLAHLPPEEAEATALARVAEVARARYDLRKDALVRPLLFRFPREHRLYLAVHHIAFDGVSLVRVLMPELITLYEAFSEGRPSPLADPPLRYADYARWEQQWIASPKAERRLDYWVDRLQRSPELAIPLDHDRPEEPTLGGGAAPLSLPPDQVERLRAMATGEDATLFQLLAAGWSLLLSHHGSQEEAVFATTADLRQRSELQALVGCCLTPLVLEVDVADDLPFSELIRRTRDELLDGLDRLVPFERVVRRLPPSEAGGGNPVYSTMIVLEPASAGPEPVWSLHPIEPELIDAVGSFKLDLELQLHEQADGGLLGQLIYDRDLFEASTAAGFVDDLLAIWAAVAADPAIGVGDCREQLKDSRVSAERSRSRSIE